MATYDVELTRKSIDGHLEYKKKFEMQGDIGGGSSGGGVLVVNALEVGGLLTCDKTAKEMWSAAQSGVVVLLLEYYGNPVSCLMLNATYIANPESAEHMYNFDAGQFAYFVADSGSGYPAEEGGSPD